MILFLPWASSQSFMSAAAVKEKPRHLQMPLHGALSRTPVGCRSLPSGMHRVQVNMEQIVVEPKKRVGRGLLLAMCSLLGGGWTFTGLMPRVPRSVAMASGASPYVVDYGVHKGLTLAELQEKSPDFLASIRTKGEKGRLASENAKRLYEAAVSENVWDKITVVPPKAQRSDRFSRASDSRPPSSRAARPASRNSAGRAPMASSLPTSDFFRIPRGLFEQHQLWNCQGDEWTRGEGDLLVLKPF